MTDFNLIENYIKKQQYSNTPFNHEDIANDFRENVLEKLDESDFIDQMIVLGYIPDLYPSDSSEEVLFSKLVEVFLCEWGTRMGYESRDVKQKASYEDVIFEIDGKVIVSDAKSFRLSRSQKAPNVKDFVKPEDYRKWLDRHEDGLGGLVAYPCTHEWVGKSDAYRYCSTESTPIVMLPYKYLAFVLGSKKTDDNSIDISPLWDYSRHFPDSVLFRIEYWEAMDKAVLEITKKSRKELDDFLERANNLIKKCIDEKIAIIEKTKKEIINNISSEIKSIKDPQKLRDKFTQYRIKSETELLDILKRRIKKFRL